LVYQLYLSVKPIGTFTEKGRYLRVSLYTTYLQTPLYVVHLWTSLYNAHLWALPVYGSSCLHFHPVQSKVNLPHEG
jgi:hypothetical protein